MGRNSKTFRPREKKARGSLGLPGSSKKTYTVPPAASKSRGSRVPDLALGEGMGDRAGGLCFPFRLPKVPRPKTSGRIRKLIRKVFSFPLPTFPHLCSGRRKKTTFTRPEEEAFSVHPLPLSLMGLFFSIIGSAKSARQGGEGAFNSRNVFSYANICDKAPFPMYSECS